MDPSIVKLLEDDEDDTMQSGVDVQALQAVLNKDVGGDISTSYPSASNANPVLSPASNMTFSQSLTKRQTSSYDNQRSQQEPKIGTQQEQPSSEMELKQHGSLPERAQYVAFQHVNPPPLLQRQYRDKFDLGQTVQVPFQNPQTTGIPKPRKDTVHNNEPVTTHDPSGELHYFKLQQMSNQQATVSAQPSFEKHTVQVTFSTLLAFLLPQLPKDRAMKLQTMFMKLKRNEISKDHFVRIMKTITGDQMLRQAATQVQSQPRTNHRPVKQHPVWMSTVSSGGKPLIDPHALAQLHQRSINTPVDQSHITSLVVQVKNKAAYPTIENSAKETQMLDVPLSSQIPSKMFGDDARTSPKRPSPGQKKPLEALNSSPPPLSEKQKVSGASLEESIEQLNDVIACSGVDLREEQQHIFSRHKEDIQVSEASRRVVQDEEERLILEKAPLHNKLLEIMAKYGLNGMSSDVERCLSLSMEERMRGLISNLISLSKQRVDFERTGHQTVFTWDVRQEVITIKKKAREEWENKQDGADKFRKINEVESNTGMDGGREKDEKRNKSTKPKGNKEEDEKMRTIAANLAARAAVGGDDMLSKWQLMAEQARQKREGRMDTSSSSQPAKDVNRESSLSSGRSTKDNQEGEKKGSGGKFGRNHVITRQARSISVKDVIAVLEREPQMSKSPLIYRLYERTHPDAPAE